MCGGTTARVVSGGALAIGLAALPLTVSAQVASSPPVSLTAAGWRHIGNSAMALALPSLATGAVDRVWYSPDGSSLFARTASGRLFETSDFEQWRVVTDAKVTPPAEEEPPVPTAPESNFKLASGGTAGRLYGVALDAYRSDDGGQSWINLTSYKGTSLLGPGLASGAVSPSDPDDVTVASATGVWRSVDG